MAKHYKILDPVQPETSRQGLQTDWSKCILCQEDTSEVLRRPAESKHATKGAGYKTIAELLVGFDRIGCLPTSINPSRLDDGNGIEETLQRHKAKWHDSCRLLYNRTKLQRAEKRKKPPDVADDSAHTSKKLTRKNAGEQMATSQSCFFCDKPAADGASWTRKASTFGLDINVRKAAMKLQDQTLLAKLSSGDLIAQEAKYHQPCLLSLYNRARGTKAPEESGVDNMNNALAFAELVSYIEDTRMDSTIAPIFKLIDLVHLYTTRLKQLGTDVTGRVHSTDLKRRILAYFPDMEAHKQGRHVILISNKDVAAAMMKSCEHDLDGDAVHLARAAKIVRRDMLNMENQFCGSFEPNSQEESVPKSLLALVAMVLNGASIEAQSSSSITQPVLTISQLLMSNSTVRRQKNEQASCPTRRTQGRETPLPIYLGVLVHTKTRKRELVDRLYDLGLSIHYDRVLAISTELGNNICHYYKMMNAVCPPELKGGLFTTAAVDNIDHNPSSTTAHDSFHGTGISLFQPTDNDSCGTSRAVAYTHRDVSSAKNKSASLPETYTNVPPVALPRKDPPVPKHEGPNRTNCQLIPQALQKEYRYVSYHSLNIIPFYLQIKHILTRIIYIQYIYRIT